MLLNNKKYLFLINHINILLLFLYQQIFHVGCFKGKKIPPDSSGGLFFTAFHFFCSGIVSFVDKKIKQNRQRFNLLMYILTYLHL